MELAKKQKKATLCDLKNVNRILKKVLERDNKIVFGKVAKVENLCVIGISDASYMQEDKCFTGEIILVGNENTNDAVPIYWKSGIIRKVCMSPKAPESRALMKIVDNSSNLLTQLSILMNRKIPLKIFTYSRPLLESIGSPRQI